MKFKVGRLWQKDGQNGMTGNFVLLSLIKRGGGLIWGVGEGGGGVNLASGNVYGRMQSACHSADWRVLPKVGFKPC